MNGAFRTTRRVAAAVAVVTLSLAGHASAGGMLPSLWGFALAVLLGWALSSLVTAGMSAVRLFAFLLGSQALLHTLFVVSSGHSSAGHAMGLVPSGSMIAGHVVASLVAVALLRHGDALLQSWARLLATAFGVRPLALPQTPDPTAPTLPIWEAAHFGAGPPTNAVSRRGPPAA